MCACICVGVCLQIETRGGVCACVCVCMCACEHVYRHVLVCGYECECGYTVCFCRNLMLLLLSLLQVFHTKVSIRCGA